MTITVTNGTDAGEYTAKFTIAYGYAFLGGSGEASAKWRIGRASIAAVPTQSGALAADGTQKSPSWSGYDTNKLTISGTLTGAKAGTYTASFTPTANYQWWDGSTGAKNASWTISSIIVPIPTQNGSLTYTGAVQTPSWSNFDTANSTVSVTGAANAGEYTAAFSLLRGTWSDGITANKTVKWSIGRATIAAVPAQSGSLTYDGNPKTPSWNSNYDSTKMTLSAAAKTLAGSYSATFTPTANYKWSDGSTSAKTVTWSIGRAAISTVPSQNGTLTYTGSAQTPSWRNYNSSQLTLGGVTTGTNAGSYNATFTPGSIY